MSPLQCTLKVWYTFRLACFLYYDVQILKIETEGSDCGVYLPKEKLFKTAYYKLIQSNPMGFPPNTCNEETPPGIYCNEQWRISLATCWATFDLDCAGHQCTVTVPCMGGDCCLQPMRICRDCPSNIIQIDPLGEPWPSENCGAAEPPPQAPPGTLCTPLCNWFLYSGIISPKIDDTNKIEKIDNVLQLKSNEFPIVITTESEGTYKILITDPYGKIYIQREGELQAGRSEIKLDLHNLMEGNYVYSIFVNGQLLKTDKLILKK